MDQHIPGPRYRGMNGASYHPLQRRGLVGTESHGLTPKMSAPGPADFGDGPPAAEIVLTLPPVVPFVGSPRDSHFMV